ncbi:hypothetical protein ABIA32_003290 [Streptacidiphilus sp. MAP12-20]|uniref:hypothetical protein n=1 Tax=Streptacidiphilus sp. MAP12-20 TaxID=3156299 RepID=UPI0035125147
MADLPTHPDAGDNTTEAPESALTPRGPRGKALAGIALGVLLVVLMLVLHLAGVFGPGSH